jgi:hypothetical protein
LLTVTLMCAGHHVDIYMSINYKANSNLMKLVFQSSYDMHTFWNSQLHLGLL